MSQNTDLYISLDQPNRVIQSPQNTDELYPVGFVFNAKQYLRLRFYRNYDIVTLDPGTVITLTLKEFDVWDTLENLATESTWTEHVNDGDVYYDGTINLDDAAMEDYFKRSRESYRMAYGAITIQHGYGFTVIPFRAKIVRTPIEP
jgi:hypothetical protein